MKRTDYAIILFSFLIFIVSCESPMDIQIHELGEVIGSSFNRAELKDDVSCSVGYYNGKITTSKVELSWSQTTDENFIFYKLTRDNNEIIVYSDITNTSFVDSMVTENTYYDYQITVFTSNGMVAKDTIEIKTAKWEAPSNLTVNGLSDTDVKLMWDDNSDSEEYFIIYLNDNTARSLIDSFTVDSNITERIVTDLDPLVTYNFTVKAFSNWEEDTETPSAVYFNMANFYFNAPGFLTANQNSDMTIELSWEDNSTLETGFAIERKINGGDFIEIAEIEEVNVEIYTDMDTLAYEIGDTLMYKVRAFNNYNFPVDYTNYSNEYVIIIIEPSTVPIPEYFLYGNSALYLSINFPGETDVIEWNSYGSDLDIDIYNYSSTMDLALRIWDENDNYLGEFNDNGTGYNDYFNNIANGSVFIIEVFDVNETTGDYEIYIR